MLLEKFTVVFISTRLSLQISVQETFSQGIFKFCKRTYLVLKQQLESKATSWIFACSSCHLGALRHPCSCLVHEASCILLLLTVRLLRPSGCPYTKVCFFFFSFCSQTYGKHFLLLWLAENSMGTTSQTYEDMQ